MRSLVVSLLFVCCIACVGCGQSFRDGEASGHDHGPTGLQVSAPQHVHPTEGPHHGDLVELGDEEFHAELIHDHATETLTVYLLDSTAMNPVGCRAPKLKINLSHDGKAEQFSLAAEPQPTDAPGESSRYVSRDRELCEELEHAHVSAQLVIAIGGKQFRGKINHAHDDGHHHEVSQKSVSVK